MHLSAAQRSPCIFEAIRQMLSAFLQIESDSVHELLQVSLGAGLQVASDELGTEPIGSAAGGSIDSGAGAGSFI